MLFGFTVFPMLVCTGSERIPLISAEKIENKAYYFTALLREFGEVDSMICHDPVLKKWG